MRRAFGPDTSELDRIHVGDITYIWDLGGLVVPGHHLDLASRPVVGWAMAPQMRAELVGDAQRTALDARRPGPGLIFHSDRAPRPRCSSHGRW